jgi:hypothetical protein
VSAAVVLDSTPLGILCHPRQPTAPDPTLLLLRDFTLDLRFDVRLVIEVVGHGSVGFRLS